MKNRFFFFVGNLYVEKQNENMMAHVECHRMIDRGIRELAIVKTKVRRSKVKDIHVVT